MLKKTTNKTTHNNNIEANAYITKLTNGTQKIAHLLYSISENSI